ncbi:hypothetical protein C8R43DRAFT_953680 [Mycena crocata]|nr:hypothetical protein C8R43DRAFT_953680 [Mycena crocata]
MSGNTSPSAARTEATASVPSAGPGAFSLPFRLLSSAASVVFGAGTSQVPAASATNLATASSLDPPEFMLPRNTGPWVANVIYSVVPPSPLAAVDEDPASEEMWYGILKGRVVGVILSHTLAQDAVTGVSHNSMRGYKTQALALKAFNDALRAGHVEIRLYWSKIFIGVQRLALPAVPSTNIALQIFNFNLNPSSNMPSPTEGLTFAELLANLSLGDSPRTPPRTPTTSRTPLRTPPTAPRTPAVPISDRPRTPPRTPTTSRTPVTTLRTPTTASWTPAIPPRTPTAPQALYYFESPGRSGYTQSWATAANASQGVEHGHVQRVQNKPKKKHTKKAAYVVFFGHRPAAYLNWADAKSAVSGAKNAIYRGYGTVKEAQDAFAYAQARGWTRCTDARGPLGPTSTPHLPQYPTPSQRHDPPSPNPLHGTEDLDDNWYVVYKGIVPGVYHSLLEAMLNTVGVSNSAYETVVGRDAAFDLFQNADADQETMFASPPPFSDTPHGL